ncbi:MAG: hypothetical protein WKF97_02515 [Chitinophagaceae bacterium]
MNKSNLSFLLPFFLFAMTALVSCRPEKKDPLKQIHSYVGLRLDSLQQWLIDDFKPLAEKNNNGNALRKSFLQGRQKYKQVEFAIEYFSPYTARHINGPAGIISYLLKPLLNLCFPRGV